MHNWLCIEVEGNKIDIVDYGGTWATDRIMEYLENNKQLLLSVRTNIHDTVLVNGSCRKKCVVYEGVEWVTTNGYWDYENEVYVKPDAFIYCDCYDFMDCGERV